MAEYVPLDKDVEVIGAAVMSVVSGLGDRAIPILEKHGLYPIDMEGWYPQKSWLEAMHELNEEGFFNAVAIGMRIPDVAVWPPDVKTVHDALSSINVAYHMNHRGGNIGDYHYTKIGEREGRMVCDNPYPSDFDYGIIYRTVQKFMDESGGALNVRRDDSVQNRKTGGDVCTYHIRW